jgi:YHS domain-containing protein
MQVETSHAPVSVEHRERRVYFCSERCRDRFLTEPDRHGGALDVGDISVEGRSGAI